VTTTVPAAVSRALGDDSERFPQALARHRVGALVHMAPPPDAPDRVLAALREARAATALATVRLLRTQRRVLDGLVGAGIPALVLKGAVVGLEAYGDPAVRQASDVDVLVEPGRVVDAVDALEVAGLRWRGIDLPADMRPADGGRAALARAGALPRVAQALLDDDGQVVELHWRLTANDRLMPLDPHWLRKPRRVQVGGVDTPVLPAREGWWHLMVHGTEHHWMRLKWVADVVALAQNDPTLVSPANLDAARAAGLERCVACGLLVAGHVLPGLLPPEAIAWARSVRGVRPLVRRSLAALSADTAGGDVVTPRRLPRHVRTRMSLRADARYRLAEMKGLLLEAGRAQLVPDPGVGSLVASPLRWAARAIRGAGDPDERSTVRPLDRTT
jgi:Uncharacterised nucleotidyltransferase